MATFVVRAPRPRSAEPRWPPPPPLPPPPPPPPPSRKGDPARPPAAAFSGGDSAVAPPGCPRPRCSRSIHSRRPRSRWGRLCRCSRCCCCSPPLIPLLLLLCRRRRRRRRLKLGFLAAQLLLATRFFRLLVGVKHPPRHCATSHLGSHTPRPPVRGPSFPRYQNPTAARPRSRLDALRRLPSGFAGAADAIAEGRGTGAPAPAATLPRRALSSAPAHPTSRARPPRSPPRPPRRDGRRRPRSRRTRARARRARTPSAREAVLRRDRSPARSRSCDRHE